MKSSQNIYKYKSTSKYNEESNYFLTKGRVSLNSFINRITLVAVIYFFLILVNHYYLIPFFKSKNAGNIGGYNFIISQRGILIYLPVFIILFILIQAVKRLHDLNKPWWFIILPVYNIFLLLQPGIKGNNTYGVDPIPNKNVKYFDELENVSEKKYKQFFGANLIRYIVLFIGIFGSAFLYKRDISEYNGNENLIVINNRTLINVSENILNRKQVNVGFLSVNTAGPLRSCIKKSCRVEQIKYIKKRKIRDALQALSEAQIDILLLKTDEIESISDDTFISTKIFYLNEQVGSCVIVLPSGNSKLLSRLNNCLPKNYN